ncbi:putative Ig domain-containing protein [Salinibacterium sp. SYSU T00001]|uniref:putative Ig domain-containing protein n=1 Tax=Homoserinimonas sedimenticola TaxID=2986805 RepID=UPI0022356E53|nr:putative Ig domain-containing protein [Salinibacterium sedimenticola]MCW4385525.1 putative Ig domain-containing protein [Salinibacterium sedimenticola]
MRAFVRRMTAAGVAFALVVLGVISMPPAAHAATLLQVTSTADSDANGACASPAVVETATPVTLRNALCVANNVGGAATITVPAGVIELTLGALEVGTQTGADITITGAGPSTVIDGNGAQALVLDPTLIGGVAVTLDSLTVRGGSDSVYGGGAVIGGSGYGPTADSLLVRNVTFTGNSSNVTGAATYTVGGAIQFIGGSLTIEDSLFEGNSSGSASGGAVAYQATGATAGEALSVTSSIFRNNETGASSVQNGGSALLIDDISQGGAALSIHDSLFEGNRSAGPGAVWVRGGTIEVLRSTFLDNTGAGAASAIHAGADVALTLHDSRLVGNTGASTVAASAGSDASDNWWGCPTGSNTAGCAVVDAPAGVASPWLTLTAAVDPEDIPFGGTSAAIAAGLLVNSDGEAVAPERLTAFAGLPVTWGTAQPAPATLSDATVALAAGETSATFVANGARGAGSVTLQLDHGSITIPVGMLYPPSFTSEETAEFTVGTEGSFTVTTDAYRAATVTVDSGLPVGLGLTAEADGTAVISGTPADGEGGRHQVELTADNSVGTAAQQTLELTVLEAPEFTSGAAIDTTLGSAISYTVTTNGYPDATLSATGLPAGIEFTDNGDGTGTLSGQVSGAGNGGLYAVVVTAENGVGAELEQSIALTVREAPSIVTAPLDQKVRAGATASFVVEALGYPVPDAQWHRSSDGGETYTLIPDATSLSYSEVTTPEQAGVDTLFRVTLSNGTGSPVSATAELVVGTAPAFTSPAATEFEAGEAGSFVVTTESIPVSALSLVGAPAWLGLEDRGDGTALLSGTAPVRSGGEYSFSILAGNTFEPDASQVFTLTVAEAPLFEATDSIQVVSGQTLALAVAPDFAGYPGVPTLTAAGALPAGLTLVDLGDGTAELRGTLSGGEYEVSITATNSVGASTQVLTIEARAVPVVTDQPESARVIAGTTATFTAAASGYPAPSVQWQSSSDGGTVFADIPGATETELTVTTRQDDNALVYRAVFTNVAGAAVTEHALLTVGTPAAFTSGTTASFTVGTEGSHNLTSSGTPAGTFTLVSAPSWLQLVDNGDGTAELVGTPTAGSGGERTAVVTLSNGFGAEAQQTVTLAVGEAATFTSAADATASVGVPADFTITTEGGFPTPTLSLSGTLPAGLSFETVDGSGAARIAGTPEVSSGGLYPLVITASSGDNDSSQVFSLTVTEAPAVTVEPVDARGDAGTELSFVAAASGYPTPQVQWQSSADDGETFADLPGETSATLAMTAAQSDDGNLYRARFSNVAGSVVSAAARVTIGTGPQFTSAPTATVLVGEESTFAVTTSAEPTASITVSGELPAWLSVTPDGAGGATITAASPAGSGGTYTIDFTASNGFGSDALQRFVLTVAEAPAAPATASHSFLVGAADSVTVATTAGFPVPALRVVGALPDGLSFTDHGDGTGSVSGTPSAAAAGAASITVLAENGVGDPAELLLSLTVNRTVEVTGDPVAARVVAGATASFSATAVGYPAPTVQWQRSVDDGATWGDIAGATASVLSFTAGQGDDGDLVRAVFSGVGVATTSAARLTVGTPPVVTSGDFLRVAAGSSATWTVSATGTPAATLTLAGAPAWLDFSDNADGSGSLVATPPADAAGSYTVTITAANGFGDDSVQTLTIEVTSAPTPVGPGGATVRAGAPASIAFGSTAGVPTATTLAIEGELPSGLRFTDEGDGTASLSGTALSGTGGVYDLTIVASNAAGHEGRLSFELTVTDVATFTSSEAVEFERGITTEFAVTTTGAFPGPATLTASGLPSGLSFSDLGDGTAMISGALLDEPGESFTVTLRAENPTAVSEQELTITTVAVDPLELPALLPFATGGLQGVPSSVTSGAELVISGTGFASFSPITLGMYSTPVPLGVVTADAAGAFSARISLPAGVTGSHHIVALGVSGGGTQHALVEELSIAAVSAVPGGSGLQVTGTDSAGLGSAAGAALLLAGLVLVGVVRRSRRT